VYHNSIAIIFRPLNASKNICKKPRILENPAGFVPKKTTPPHQLAEQIWIPNLNEKLVNQLSDERSNLSLYLESNFEWNKRIQPDYKPSFGSRLRLLYYFLIVQNDFNFLRTYFKIDSKHVKIPPSASTLDRLTNKRLDEKVRFFLAYQHPTKFKGRGKNLVLTPWLETLRYKTVNLTETKYVRLKEELTYRIKQRGKLKTPKKEKNNSNEIERLKNIILEEEMKFKENYVSLEMLLQKDNPIKLAYIKRRKKIFERYQDYAKNCQRAFDNSYRKMQYQKPSQDSEFQEIKPSLKTEYGIKSYGQYISRIMNAAWQYYSEDLKRHHNTIIPPQSTPLAGVHGRNRGWKNLVAAVVMVKGKWTEDFFNEFKGIYKNDPILKSIPSLVDAQKRFEQFISNFGEPKPAVAIMNWDMEGDDEDGDVSSRGVSQQDETIHNKKYQPHSKIEKLLRNVDYFSNERKIRVKVESLRMSLKNNQQKKKFFPDIELKYAERIILNDYLHRERRVPNQMD
jgi:hypothetical protein